MAGVEGQDWSRWLLLGGVTTVGGIYAWLKLRRCSKAPPRSYDVNHGRPLGVMERVFFEGCERGWAILSNVIVMGTKTKVGEPHIHEVLERLCKIHPLLNMQVVRKWGQLWYEPVQDTEAPLTAKNGTNWILEMELATLEKPGGEGRNERLWKVVYLPNAELEEKSETHPHQCVLVFIFNHTFIDGVSYMRLFGDVMDMLADVIQEKPFAAQSLPLMLPLDEYIEPTLNESMRVKFSRTNLWFMANFTPWRKHYIQTFLEPRNNIWVKRFGIEKTRNPNLEECTRVSPFCLSEEDTSKLLLVCRTHKVTVQAVVQAAASCAVARLWTELDQQHPGLEKPVKHRPKPDSDISVGTSLPINIRNQFGHEIEPRHLGLYMNVGVLYASVPMGWDHFEHIWTVATEINETIQDQIKHKKYLWFYNIVGKLRGAVNITNEEWTHALKNHKDQGGRHATILMFTNLGNCSFLNRTNDSPVKLLARYGASAEHSVGSIFGNNIATFEGRLFWNMVYYPHITSKKIFDKYVQYTKENIQRIID